jgi:malonate-semialdehyde dehydrogenase (acetylating)/methylmalonate-semialdehyde dehydrogenase
MTDTIIRHWIDGKPDERPAERLGDVFNPATGQVQARVALASPAVVDQAVASAKAAAASWKSTSLAKRTKILFAFRELVDRRQKDIAAILTREHGKVLSDALGEVTRGLEVVEFACGIPHLLKGELLRERLDRGRRYSIRQPLGVVAGITPFNFPAMVPMWMSRSRSPAATPSCSSRPSAIRRPPTSAPSCSPRPACPTACSTSCTATRSRSTRLLEHPDVAAVSLRRLHADREVHLRDRRARQARAGAGRRQEPHDRAARRRPGAGRRRRDRRRLRLGRRALHGDLGGGRRRRRRRR